MTTEVKPLGETSWIVYNDNGAQGLLLSVDDQWVFTTIEDTQIYPDWGFLGEYKMRPANATVENIEQSINGYPCRHANPSQEGVNNTNGWPEYHTGGHMLFVAGWWVLQFNSQPTLALCPKLSTVEKNQGLGPFKTRLEAQQEIRIMNRKDQQDEI